MTVISEQVIKDQGAPTLPTRSKTSPAWVRFFAGENGNSTTGTPFICAVPYQQYLYRWHSRYRQRLARHLQYRAGRSDCAGRPAPTTGSAPTGSINMIVQAAAHDSGIDASASIGSAWFRRGTLDVNQVIGDTTAVRLNVMGETHDAGRDKNQK